MSKVEALKIDPAATCRMERERPEPQAGEWAIVRDKSGEVIGRHRTPKAAWQLALSKLRRRRLEAALKHVGAA